MCFSPKIQKTTHITIVKKEIKKFKKKVSKRNKTVLKKTEVLKNLIKKFFFSSQIFKLKFICAFTIILEVTIDLEIVDSRMVFTKQKNEKLLKTCLRNCCYLFFSLQ